MRSARSRMAIRALSFGDFTDKLESMIDLTVGAGSVWR